MKVKSDTSGHCDFCGFYQAEFTINGGLWWICRPCMELAYGPCPCDEDAMFEHLSYCKMEGEEE